MVGHTDCQTTSSIYAHVRDGMLVKRTVNTGDVFRKREKEWKRENAPRRMMGLGVVFDAADS